MSTLTLPELGGRPEPMEPLPYIVTRTHRETYDTVTLVLEPERAALTRWEPGQFTMVYAFGIGEIPISVSGDPVSPGRLVHTVRDVGAVSHAVATARVGDVLGVRGPFGRGWLADGGPDGDVVLVAGGLGLAPLRPLIYGLTAHRRRFGRVTLVIGARSPADLLYTREYEAWRACGVDVRLTVDRPGLDGAAVPWAGPVGLVTTPLSAVPIEGEWTTAFLCGPEPMMRVAAEALTARAVPAKRIVLSLERSMKCGIGVCGHCQLGPDLICRDGPCVSYDHAGPLLDVKEF